jgi:hypothetical protein
MHWPGRRHSQVWLQRSPISCVASQIASVTVVGGANTGSGVCAQATSNTNTPNNPHFIDDKVKERVYIDLEKK